MPEPFSEPAQTLLDGAELLAPAHWQAEAVNAVRKRVHRQRLSISEAGECTRLLVIAVPLAGLLERAFDLAVRLRMSIYQALYVALALKRRIPLVSDDHELPRRMTAEPSLAPLSVPVRELPLHG